MSNNLGNTAMNPIQNLGSPMTLASTAPNSMISTSGHQQNILTPMDLDPGLPTNPLPSQTSLPNLTSSSPGLGNLQSVMGSCTTSIVSSSAATASATQHSTLASALQGSSSNTITSINNMMGTSSMGTVGPMPLGSQSSLGSQMKSSTSAPPVSHESSSVILTRPRLQDLVREVDPTEQLDEEVEELLLQLADDFVESTVSAACLLAKHRKASTVEVKDVQLHLERQWNMWLPGFGTDELRPYKRAPVTEAHKQRLALIRKALKKY